MGTSNGGDRCDRGLRIGEIYRYPKPPSDKNRFIDGCPNFYYFTASPFGKRLQLDSGINSPRKVLGTDSASRIPLIAVRSSPWKAGGEETPWKDDYDLERGRVRYYGDHKVGVGRPLGETKGNKCLLEASALHLSRRANERVAAPPIMVFRAVTYRGKVKGWVEFCGVAVIERVETIEQRDPTSGKAFPNYAFDLAILATATEGGFIDWRWIDDRRDPGLSAADTLRYAPRDWRDWVDIGPSAIDEIRRRQVPDQAKSTPSR